MADVPPGTKRFLWHERLHEVGGHEGAWPEDLRGEPANGGKVRLAGSEHRFLPSSSAADAPPGVEFVNDAIGPFVSRLREQPGKDNWLMGGGEIIASFLDALAIDEFVISVVPVFIGDGIPLIARRHRHVPLDVHSVDRFEDGVFQLHYR